MQTTDILKETPHKYVIEKYDINLIRIRQDLPVKRGWFSRKACFFFYYQMLEICEQVQSKK